MAITVRKFSNNLYVATATPKDVDEAWITPEPLTADLLINELRKRGAHQTDIGDAFYAADPDWLKK